MLNLETQFFVENESCATTSVMNHAIVSQILKATVYIFIYNIISIQIQDAFTKEYNIFVIFQHMFENNCINNVTLFGDIWLV